jgi:hypothetical protein
MNFYLMKKGTFFQKFISSWKKTWFILKFCKYFLINELYKNKSFNGKNSLGINALLLFNYKKNAFGTLCPKNSIVKFSITLFGNWNLCPKGFIAQGSYKSVVWCSIQLSYQLPNLVSKGDQMFWQQKKLVIGSTIIQTTKIFEQLPKDFQARIKFFWTTTKMFWLLIVATECPI